jgi:hypothetical protein
MKNAFMRFGLACVPVAMLTGLAIAGQVNRITVTLPHAVTVGSVTLPIGQYTISSLDISDGEKYFIVRGDHTPVVTIQGQKVDANDTTATTATQVMFSKDGDEWHFEKLFARGFSYQFVNAK